MKLPNVPTVEILLSLISILNAHGEGIHLELVKG